MLLYYTNAATESSRNTSQTVKKGHTMTKTSFTTLSMPQTAFLEQHLRGTGKTISEAQARATYGIQNLRARMTDLRQAGLKVNTGVNSYGKTVYSVSARDVFGSRAKIFTQA
jgi:Helix-turn-helix domain